MKNREQQKIKGNSRQKTRQYQKKKVIKVKKKKKCLPNLTTKTLMVYNVYNGL